tara:strand:+ start:9748 stop:9885 length:138 start_codon:yes stop_codon:yes gene_type:complete
VFASIDQMGGHVDPHSGPGEGQLCDDNDGRLLQPEAVGVLPAGRD